MKCKHKARPVDLRALNRKYSTGTKNEHWLVETAATSVPACISIPYSVEVVGHACTGISGRRPTAFFSEVAVELFSLLVMSWCPLHFHLFIQKWSFLWSSHSELDNSENMRDQYFELRQMLRPMMDGLEYS